jgi:hypothetical protein
VVKDGQRIADDVVALQSQKNEIFLIGFRA